MSIEGKVNNLFISVDSRNTKIQVETTRRTIRVRKEREDREVKAKNNRLYLERV